MAVPVRSAGTPAGVERVDDDHVGGVITQRGQSAQTFDRPHSDAVPTGQRELSVDPGAQLPVGPKGSEVIVTGPDVRHE